MASRFIIVPWVPALWEHPAVDQAGNAVIHSSQRNGPKYLNRWVIQWPAHGHGWAANHMGLKMLVEIQNGNTCPTCKDMADWLASQFDAEEV